MASVKSLGLHKPTGLQIAIEENILAPNASSSSYSWEIKVDEEHGNSVEDELLTTKTCVIWCRGGTFRKTFDFALEKEDITQALVAYFPASEDDRNQRQTPAADGHRSKSPVEKALVVFLQTQAHIYFLSGTEHIVHLPFEVESAFAGPVGVVIQRKRKAESVAPLPLKFPRVPPNSFLSSSQQTAFTSSQQTTFSVEAMGKPRPLHLNLSQTIEATWEAPLAPAESHWPRLVSLTDPLLEIGLVVTDSDRKNGRSARHGPSGPRCFLDSAEEILHLERVKLPEAFLENQPGPLTLAITANRDNGTYSFWRVEYLPHDDPFTSKYSPSTKLDRRRVSMPAAMVNDATTPMQTNFRESVGAPLPGKRQQKSEKIEKPIDLVSSLEEKEAGGVARRSSRRVSSMMARADLSASHERAGFVEPLTGPGQALNRTSDSLGGHNSRLSSTYSHQIHPSLGSLLEAPLDLTLDEGLHKMGLDDHDFDGLQHEVRFAKIHTSQMDNTNVRYSTSNQPAHSQSKVFILTAPPFSTDEHQRSRLLIGIQDVVEKRLQLMMIHLKSYAPARGEVRGRDSPSAQVFLSPGEVRRAQNVVDSCRLVDGHQSALLVLSEAANGHHELSLQAPWSELTKIALPRLLVDNTRNLQFRGRAVDRDVKHRKSEVMDLASGSAVGLKHPRPGGIVDIQDADGRLHQLKIQLQPESAQVAKALDICRSVLPDALGERIYVGWLHVIQWLHPRDVPHSFTEWSSFAVLLFSLFLNLGEPRGNSTTSRFRTHAKQRASGSFGSLKESENWKALNLGEAPGATGYPSWMMSEGWQWMLDEAYEESATAHSEQGRSKGFVSRHISLAKAFLTSSEGEAALGNTGYLPTAKGKSDQARRKIAVDIFMALHLLLEEQKLDITTPENTWPGRTDLRVLLGQISRWLKWKNFAAKYELGIQESIEERHDAEINLQSPIPEPPFQPDVFAWLQTLFTRKQGQFLTPCGIFYSGSTVSEVDQGQDVRWEPIVPRTLMFQKLFRMLGKEWTAAQMVETMMSCGFTRNTLETLPEAVAVPLQDAITICQSYPPSSWSRDLLELVRRSDISLVLEPEKHRRLTTSNILAPSHIASWDYKLLCQSVDDSNNTGYEEGEATERQSVIRTLFKDDRRLSEAQDLLGTQKARHVRLEAETGQTESEYLERQKELVSRIATGTLAIPAGRGLLYFSLRYPLITQKFHISGFNLNCVVSPGNVTVGVDKSLFTEEKVCWGFFNQGVASGLTISPQAKGIDTSWILYNKPAQELSNRHAGFLLALGLTGHLKGVAKWVAFKYLTPKHTMTSVGLLLGLAASYMGTMDSLITRLLSVHATRMLPRGAAELNLSHLTQTSAIMGIGLLYCNSQHRRMSEIMLSEIEHTEEEDDEEPLRSECYRLAAGFALGFINIGKGGDLKGLRDMKLTEKLIARATATKNVDIVHVLDRAAAGAVMAIALIFMKSEDQAVARKIDVPESMVQFDYVRPDILLLRTIAKNLVMWSKIKPTFAWIQGSLPKPYQSNHKLDHSYKLKSSDLPFFSILSGICFSIGLRFSGSGSTKVRDLLLDYLDHFMRITKLPSSPRPGSTAKPAYDEELARSSARTCQDIVALSVAIVMAGTGDIPVLRRLRSLHGRDDPDTPYGSHLAAHLAIGALFLGCGTATFGSSNVAIASLLVAFYPIFPTNVMDNRAHLQALRHFWVLATEQRCLVVKDITTGHPISVPIEIRMTHSSVNGGVIHRTTPCLLPPLEEISRLSTQGAPDYWDIELDFGDEKVRVAFHKTQSIYLRRKAPRDDAFTSTLAALGKDNTENPLEWIFGLNALGEINYAEQTAVLDIGVDGEELTSAMDAALEVDRGILDGGDLERIEGARMLFEWGLARSKFWGPDVARSQETVRAEGSSSSPATGDDATRDWQGTAGDNWWVRNGVIEGIKRKIWFPRGDRE